MKALGSFVLLEEQKEEIKNDMGLIVTASSEQKIRYKLAKVVTIGKDVNGINAGDSVYYDTAAGSDIRVNGKKLVVVHDRGVVIVL
tara:strand:- start:2980 stop:3237 length:258 start_codon:yes stop_codon:yes gene_type:complete